jgi:hypothetical protein
MPVALFPDIFEPAVVDAQIARIRQLTAASRPLWGTMSAPAMLAHVNVAYEMVYDGTHRAPGLLVRLLLRLVAKRVVTGLKPYPKGTPTAPQFIITGERDFEAERTRLEAHLRRVAAEGRAAFEGRPSLSFGPLTADEWQVLFGKHLDHHLRQFGV